MAEKKTAAKKITVKDLLDQKDPSKAIQSLTFEEGLQLLEELVEQVEGGALDLDKALASYERGTLLLARLREELGGAEKKLEILSESKK